MHNISKPCIKNKHLIVLMHSIQRKLSNLLNKALFFGTDKAIVKLTIGHVDAFDDDRMPPQHM